MDTVFLQDDGKVRVNYEKDSYDYLVLAVPAAALAKLVLDPDPGFLGFGGIIKEGSIVDQLPGLSELRRLRAERIAVVDLYFKKKLPGIPKEHVALIQSNGDLTFLDISQLWTDDSNMRDRTVLVLAASDVYALPAADIYARPSKNTRIMQKNAYVMIQTLHRYLPVFNPGEHWGDPKSDICYTKSQFLSNVSNTLFVNEVGSWAWRPTASYEALPNVFFAGDFCRTDVDMATVEAAVLSGLLAAQALWKKKPRGKPIVIAKSRVYGDSTFLALKLLLMPFAYGAKGWSTAYDAAPELFQGNLSRGLISPAASMMPLPVTYTVEWWKTAYAFWKSVLGAGKGQSESAGTVESSVLSLKVK